MSGIVVIHALLGENLARIQLDPVYDQCPLETTESACMDSATLSQNLLEPCFTRAAIGAAVDAGGQLTVAELFAGDVQLTTRRSAFANIALYC